MTRVILTVLTDEFSWKLAKAIPQIIRFPEVRHVDLRNVDHKNVINFTPGDVQRVKDLLAQFGNLKVACIGSPAGKRRIPVTGAERVEVLGTLDRAIEMARQFDAPFIRVFGFRREPDVKGNYEAAVALFKEFAEKAVTAGVDLAVENEGGYWGAVPDEMDQFLRDVGSLRAWNLLDPGNHLNQNQHLLEEKDVALLAPRTKYIHVKDARRGQRGYVVVGTGDIPYVSIFRQLREARVEPVICLETHLGGLFRGRTSARCLTNLIGSIRASGYNFG